MPKIQLTSKYKVATKPVYLASVDTLLQLWDDTITNQEGFAKRSSNTLAGHTRQQMTEFMGHAREALEAQFDKRTADQSWFEITDSEDKVVRVVLGRYSVGKRAYITGWSLTPVAAVVPPEDEMELLTVVHGYVRNVLKASRYLHYGYPTTDAGEKRPEVDQQAQDSELVDSYVLKADSESDYNMELEYKLPDLDEDNVWQASWSKWETEQATKKLATKVI